MQPQVQLPFWGAIALNRGQKQASGYYWHWDSASLPSPVRAIIQKTPSIFLPPRLLIKMCINISFPDRKSNGKTTPSRSPPGSRRE